MKKALWTPSATRIENTHMRQFIAEASRSAHTHISNYDSLYDWSIENPEAFWELVWSYGGVVASRPPAETLTHPTEMPGAQWFSGSRLNFAENLLKFDGDQPAIIFVNERNDRIELSWSELRRQVGALTGTLRGWGVGPGDRVAGFLPNRPEAIVAMLATASLGATWSSCSPDFGVNGVIDRFGQIKPKVLFAVDGYFYAGKTIDSAPTVREIVNRLTDLDHLVTVPYIGNELSTLDVETTLFQDTIAKDADLQFTPVPFDHPLYILYSSGTTGVPKCIVHGVGGTLIQHLKEHLLHTDVHRGDRLFYFTTCGWMMWNWLASGLASGATLILFDGSPFHPDPGVLWRIAEQERVNIFGTSAKYLSALQKAPYEPSKEHDLSALRTILSTGSPLTHESYDFVYEHIKDDVQLSSISGGTDIISCFAIGNPILPVYRGEIQCRGLGMKTEIYDDDGTPVKQQKGELVCTAPFPSMPIGFFNDPDNSRYRAAYFERFENVWCHGDYAELTAHNGIIIYGRSDAVLNPGGVRIGTAEIYRVVEKLPAIAESIVIGQQWQGDVRVILFCTMQPGFDLDEPLKKEIKMAIRAGASPRHVPAVILTVPDIPRTISGKIVELAVRDIVHGREVKNTEALANPEALGFFANRPELQA